MISVTIDTREINAALARYMTVTRKDSVTVLKNTAGDLCLRSAEVAKKNKSQRDIKNLWAQHWTTYSKGHSKPWQRGADMWALFTSKLLSGSGNGFKLNLGRRRVKNEQEALIVNPQSLRRGYRGVDARPVSSMRLANGKIVRKRTTMTEFRVVRRGQMKSKDWKRVSQTILRRRSARVGAFVAAFAQAAAWYGKRVTRVRVTPWPAEVRMPSMASLFTYFAIPIKGSRYPMRGNQSVSQQADAAGKQRILESYMRLGVREVLYNPKSGLVPYITRKLRQRALEVGLEAA